MTSTPNINAELHSKGRMPVLLLKTKSTPTDAYEEVLKSSACTIGFEPYFVPVLQHHFDADGAQRLDSLLRSRRISRWSDADYGGIIFTSQRAVEAFSQVVQDGKGNETDWPYLGDVPIYTVGPATARALAAVSRDQPLQIFGQDTGNGETLANFILDHYGTWYGDRQERPPLLFLVGEQRRDVIPRVLMDQKLPATRRIRVDEVVMYGTGVMESFSEDFSSKLHEIGRESSRWIVVFSPTGCDSMLRCLGWLDLNTSKVDLDRRDDRTFIVTIGPTTRNHLLQQFGFEPDVCAKSPSPDGILEGIAMFRPSSRSCG